MQSALRWLEHKVVHSWWFAVVVLVGAGAALFYFNHVRTRPAQVVRVAYAASSPVRKYFLEQLAIHARKRNLDIQLVTTDGTDQTLSLIDQQAADLGLIPGAIEDRASRKVFEVAPLYMEPLQLLVKPELYEPVAADFERLRGRSINIDAATSATSVLASELLRFIGLTDATGQPQYRPVHIPQAQLTSVQDAAALPDAIFQLGGVPSATLRHLVATHGYRLVALPFGGSFNLSKFRESGTAEPGEGQALSLNKAFVEESVIPAFVYNVLPPVPPADTRTIGTRLILVGREQLSNEVVSAVLDVILGPDVSTLVQPALHVDLLNSSFEFERHAGTELYLRSLEPIDVEGAFETYARFIEVWGIIGAVYFAGSRWLKKRRDKKAHRESQSVGDFMSQVLAVEAAAAASSSTDDRVRLDQQLTDIKRTSIELHLDGRLDDAESLPSLLVTVADARTRIWGLGPRP